MLLSNLRIAGEPGQAGESGQAGTFTLLIEKGKIARVNLAAAAAEQPFSPREGVVPRSPGEALVPRPAREGIAPRPGGEIVLRLPGAIVFPGLINSHDHLDFNLYPRLGNAIYSNYTVWGRDIHSTNALAIQEVLTIPSELRTRWGLYKNLLNGFTTVVNHGVPLETGVPVTRGGKRVPRSELITVFQDCHNLHSVGFEKNWRWKLNRRSGDRPVVIHVGEGTDHIAGREIDRLIRWNLFKKTLIGVHGVAMDERQAEHFRALVWCPDSNYFLLDRTAAVGRLKDRTTLLFGTDSTLTSGWNHWDQIRMARQEGAVTDEELLEMMTRGAAEVWGMGDVGEIAEGRGADLVIARPGAGAGADAAGSGADAAGLSGKTLGEGMDDFYSLNPGDLLLVLHKGNVRLFDESLLSGLVAGGFDPEGFYKIRVQGACKYVEGDLPGLIKEVRSYQAEAAFPLELTTE